MRSDVGSRLRSGTVLMLLILPSSLGPPAGAAEGLDPCARAHEAPPGLPVNVELATVSDREAVLTWLTCADGRPAPADSTVTYTSYGSYGYPGSGGTVVAPGETAFHHVVVDDLAPGTTYVYEVSSNGLPAPVDRSNPGVFTTLTAPPGELLFSFAIVADTHIGESVSGLATSSPDELPPGYRSDTPYAETLLRAAVDQIDARGLRFTVSVADTTTHGELPDMVRARALFEELDGGFLVARGSHDRPDQYEAAAKDCGAARDCFRKVFRPGIPATSPPMKLPAARTRRGWSLIVLDSVDLDSGNGQLGAQQLEWLRARLEASDRRGHPSIIFFHHPVAEYSTTLAVPPAVFGLPLQEAREFLELIAAHDVRLVVSSHTHRNWIGYSDITGSTPLIEVGPTKEYPAGFSVIRVYEGGLVRLWFPIDCAFCNQWRQATRGEYFGLYPLYTLGSLRDRNFVHEFDGPDVPGIPSIPLGFWPPGVPGRA